MKAFIDRGVGESSELADSSNEITSKNMEGALEADQWVELNAMTDESGTDHSSYVRKSSRKRKPNPRLGEYITVKSQRTELPEQAHKVKVVANLISVVCQMPSV